MTACNESPQICLSFCPQLLPEPAGFFRAGTLRGAAFSASAALFCLPSAFPARFMVRRRKMSARNWAVLPNIFLPRHRI